MVEVGQTSPLRRCALGRREETVGLPTPGVGTYVVCDFLIVMAVTNDVLVIVALPQGMRKAGSLSGYVFEIADHLSQCYRRDCVKMRFKHRVTEVQRFYLVDLYYFPSVSP